MRIVFDPATRGLHISLTGGASSSSAQVAPGVVLDYDESGTVIGVELEDAGSVDLSTLQIEGLAGQVA